MMKRNFSKIMLNIAVCLLPIFLFSQNQDSIFMFNLNKGNQFFGEIIDSNSTQFILVLEQVGKVFIDKKTVENYQKIGIENKKLGIDVNAAQLKNDFNYITNWDKIVIKNETQKHVINTTWGQRYKGTIIELTNKDVKLETPNKMQLNFTLSEIESVGIQGVKESEKGTVSEKKVQYYSKREKVSPHRIFVSPVALPKIPNQIEYRASAFFLNEWTFSTSSKFLYFTLGGVFYRPFARMQINLPVHKYINIGIGGAASLNTIQVITVGEGRNDNSFHGHYFGILTLGNADYFLNFVYKSKSEVFLPSFMIDSEVPFARSIAFGGGIKIAERWQIIGETIFYHQGEFNNSKKVNLGVRWDIGRHSFGGGINVIDDEKKEEPTFFQPDNFPRTFVNAIYAVRF